MSVMPEMDNTATEPVFERILCATELSPAGAEAVRQASVLAAAGGSLEIVSLAPERPPGAPRPQARQSEALVEASALASQLGVHAEVHIIDGGRHAATLLARCPGHDLLVVPGRAVQRSVIVGSPIPVLVTRPAPEGSTFPDSLLVAVDGTPAASDAARVAARLAAQNGALVALVATPEHDARHQHALQDDVAVVREITGADPLVLDEQRPPVPSILGAAASSGATLIVLGSRPGTPADSVSAEVAQNAACSVLVQRRSQGATVTP